MIAYGREWPSHLTQLEIELICFRERLTPEQGALGPFRHFQNIVALVWPVGGRKTFVWTPEATDMIQEACRWRYLGVAGCASSGKSDAFAVWGLVNWLADPLNTLVLVTSTSLKDSRKRIWGAIVDYWAASAVSMPGKLADSIGVIRTVVPGFPTSDRCGIHLIPGEKKKERESIGRLIGIKSPRLIIVGDEMSELSPALIEACANLENSGPGFQMIGLANPGSHYDPHGQLCTPKAGWKHTDVENLRGWETVKGYCLRLDVEQTANYKSRSIVYPWQPSYEQVEKAKEELGPKSRAFYRMYKAAWCPDVAEQRVLAEADLQKGNAFRNSVVWLGPPRRVAGLDLGWSTGGDRTVLVYGLLGETIEGVPVLLLEGMRVLVEDTTLKGEPRTFQLARQVKTICEELRIPPSNFALDTTGSGGSFYDILTVVWGQGVMPVYFGGPASDRMVGLAGNRRPAKEVAATRATELWLAVRDFIHSQQVAGVFSALAEELIERKIGPANNSPGAPLVVEPKKDLRKRTGKSCDVADAALVLVELCREKFRFKATATRRNLPTPVATGEFLPASLVSGRDTSPARTRWRRMMDRFAVGRENNLVDDAAGLHNLW